MEILHLNPILTPFFAGMNKILTYSILSLSGFDTVSSIAEVIRDVEAQLGLRSCR